jgi:HK97 family phage prohead protease
MGELLTFSAGPGVVTADVESRTVRGLAVPWDVVGMASTGPVRFLPGSLTPAPHLLLRDHDPAQAIGRVHSAETDDTGATITARVSDVPAGDEALVLAADGVLTGLSVGVRPTEYTYEADPTYGDVMVVAAGEWAETSLVPFPAFNAARVTDVAATATTANPIPEDHMSTTHEAAPAVAAEQEAPAVVAAAPRTTSAVVTASRPLPTPGEWLFASIKRNEAPARWDDMQAAVRAASPHTFVEDVPGIIPSPIVGDVFSGRPEDRPVISSLGPLTGPDGGKTFSRPKITDPILDAAAATEKSDVTDQMKVAGVDFTYAYIKRAFNLSAEAIAFTSPQVLDVAVRDLGRAYARGSEKVAATALEAIDATATAVTADALEAGLYAAAATMYGSIGELPDRLWVATDVWGFLATAKAADGRALYPRLNPTNATGDNPGGVRMFDIEVAGLRAAVSWALGAGVAVLGSSGVIEAYEGHRVQMRQEEATILGVAVGVGGAVALGALDPAGAAKFTVTAAAKPAAPAPPASK